METKRNSAESAVLKDADIVDVDGGSGDDISIDVPVGSAAGKNIPGGNESVFRIAPTEKYPQS